MSGRVEIDRNLALRVQAFLAELAHWGYERGVPDELRDLVATFLVPQDTEKATWGLTEDDQL